MSLHPRCTSLQPTAGIEIGGTARPNTAHDACPASLWQICPKGRDEWLAVESLR